MSRIQGPVADRLKEAELRLKEIAAQLSDPAVASSSSKIKDLYKEHGKLAPLVELYDKWRQSNAQLAEAESLRDDPELQEMAGEEIQLAKDALQEAEDRLVEELAPRNPDDDKNAFLEIRAGTGGLESCLFAGDLLRLYTHWAERNNLTVQTISTSPGEVGGYKEIIVKIEGRNPYALFKHEAGAHRVQRVPETESQGRIHTSVCTVAVMPEIEVQEVGINPSELRVDTYRSSGAGGQHVNTTDSAVRITHLPTGIVAECQNDRSQHRNREKAMEILAARVSRHHRSIHEAEQVDARRKMVGSGERNEKIRTYNYPQGRVTDHRVNLTIRRLKEILEGDLDEIHMALRQAERAEQLAGDQA